jgi:hypothetical protein
LMTIKAELQLIGCQNVACCAIICYHLLQKWFSLALFIFARDTHHAGGYN